MGCFSWKFADTDNQQRLRIGHRGYLALPDGNFLCADSYEGYGEFDGRDVYELVVWWNREYIAKNPDAEVKAYSITLHDYAPKKLKDFWWYPVIADPSLIGPEVNRKLKELGPHSLFYVELRGVGIDIACDDQNNAALPFPIKVTKTTKKRYWELPPSIRDPDQGM